MFSRNNTLILSALFLGFIPGSLQAQESSSFWDKSLVGFTFAELGASFLILFGALLFRRIVTRILFARLKALAEKTEMSFDDDILRALEKPASFFLLFIAIYFALVQLSISPNTERIVGNLFRGSSMLLVVWALLRLVDVFGDLLGAMVKDKGSALHGFIPLLKKTMKIFIFMVGLLIIIDNLGYNVTGVLATFGLGGAAIALASKDTIANLFGSLMIVLDRPFKVGDWIQVGDKVDGDVEEIGLRSTKVRTWPKTIISIPNSILANEYINNWSRMPKRRVKQYVGISYEATAEQMDELVAAIREMLKNDEGVQQDFILVNFTDFGDYSLNILVYYFTKTTAWVKHMDVRQRVNTQIMELVKAHGLSIAFPTNTLYLEGEVAKRMAGMGSALPDDHGPQAPQ